MDINISNLISGSNLTSQLKIVSDFVLYYEEVFFKPQGEKKNQVNV